MSLDERGPFSLSTAQQAQAYHSFINNAVDLVRGDDWSVEDIDYVDDLPTSVERIRHCVELTLEAAQDAIEDPEPQQFDRPTDPEEIDWATVFSEFGLYRQAGYSCASLPQLAGAIAVSDNTGFRMNTTDRRPMAEVVRQAADLGQLTEVERESAIVGYLHTEVLSHD